MPVLLSYPCSKTRKTASVNKIHNVNNLLEKTLFYAKNERVRWAVCLWQLALSWCHRESRPQEGDVIAQAWSTWPEVMCQGIGVTEMVTLAMRFVVLKLLTSK